MEDYQQRVIDEKADLDERHAKLIAFAQSERFGTLPEAEQERMKRQSQAMDAYSTVLGERIEAFED